MCLKRELSEKETANLHLEAIGEIAMRIVVACVENMLLDIQPSTAGGLLSFMCPRHSIRFPSAESFDNSSPLSSSRGVPAVLIGLPELSSNKRCKVQRQPDLLVLRAERYCRKRCSVHGDASRTEKPKARMWQGLVFAHDSVADARL